MIEKDADGHDGDYMVTVAPFALPGGYTFDVIVDGVTIPVTVPPGGCKEGDIIEIPTLNEEISERNNLNNNNNNKSKKQSPGDDWNHGLFSCLEVGCSGLFWMSLCFPYVVLGQLMQRDKLNIWGMKNEYKHSTCALVICFTIIFGYIIPGIFVFLGIRGNNFSNYRTLFYAMAFAFSVYCTLVVLYWNTMLRNQLRQRLGIKPTSGFCYNCPGFIDFCTALFCQCCSLIQIGRQFPKNTYYCCSPTGLAPTNDNESEPKV